ncbi:MAG: hypothetical protein ABIL70_00260 [candidate division WOR-3 bacterium]
MLDSDFKIRIAQLIPISLLLSGILHCNISRQREDYILLNEVIPEANIISQTECILEYRGNIYIIGPGDFKKKKDLIYKLDLVNIPGPVEIDLRYRRQVIIRKR